MSECENVLKVPFWKVFQVKEEASRLDAAERFELILEDFEAELLRLYPNPQDITRDGIGSWLDNTKQFAKQLKAAERFVSRCIDFNGLDEEQVWSYVEAYLEWKLQDRNRD